MAERLGTEQDKGAEQGKKEGGPPVRRSAGPSSGVSRYLREDERIYIADRVREKATIRKIARELGRAPSTISREIRRNRHPANGQYRPHAAQARADAHRPRPEPRKIGQNPELRAYIQKHLHKRWSSEQIVQSLHGSFPDRPEMHVCHEIIYQALYVQGHGELRRELTKVLRTGRAMRKPRRLTQQRQPRYSAPMLMISERPAEADDRAYVQRRTADGLSKKEIIRCLKRYIAREVYKILIIRSIRDEDLTRAA